MKVLFSKNLLLLLGSVVLALLFFFVNPFGVPPAAGRVLAIAVLMVFLWVTEALPMPVVALFPLLLFPLLGIAPIAATAPAYANPVIFLFMGGFLIGLAIEKWNLHRRIALTIVNTTGTSGNRIIIGFMMATALLSMWLSNTATTMMMFPIALSVIHVVKEAHEVPKQLANFSLALMLSIAFAANFGGISTLIGTPPNVAYAAFIQSKYNYSIDFFRWMIICTPLAILLLAALYFVMVKWLYPNGIKENETTHRLIQAEIKQLGPFTIAEKRVLLIFIATALLWMTKDLVNKIGIVKLDDTMIALMGAIALFIFRSGGNASKPLLQWSDTGNMAWGILLLFGGGIALATALENAGLIEQLGQWFGGFGASRLMIIFLVTITALFLSEVMSNVAQVIVFAPVVSALADALHVNPYLLGIPMTLAASCASMLPMGTPPNAIVFASGYIKLHQMTRVGLVMNLISIFLITLFCWYVLPLVM
ncbi:MAG: SLC13 family permease [Chitinophagaceae bacterium]